MKYVFDQTNAELTYDANPYGYGLPVIKTHDGKEIYTTQQAYCESNGNETWYECIAIDASTIDEEYPTEYKIKWELVDNESDEPDQDCDWDVFDAYII